MSEPTVESAPADEFHIPADVVRRPDPGDLHDPILEVEGLRKSFGGLAAVDGVSFQVRRGAVTGLIGPNGAGKSTTFDLISGLYDLDAGAVRFNGEEIGGQPSHRIARRGLVRTFQIAREFHEMTVTENLMLPPRNQSGEALWRSVLPIARERVRAEEAALLERVRTVMEFFELDHLATEYAGHLSGGQRKLLEFARVLVTDPYMILLDEPFAGVNPTLEAKLLSYVHELADAGFTFLMVEHDMDLIMNHCEHVFVMDQGSIIADGPPEAVRENERVADAYLGRGR